jgi:hypothetical protein
MSGELMFRKLPDGKDYAKVRRLRVPMRIVLDNCIFGSKSRVMECLETELPKGTTIVAVDVNSPARTVDVILHNESFEPCPEGSEPPDLDGPLMLRLVVVMRFKGLHGFFVQRGDKAYQEWDPCVHVVVARRLVDMDSGEAFILADDGRLIPGGDWLPMRERG